MTKKLGLEKLAAMYRKNDQVAKKEVEHHPNLKAILDNGYKPVFNDGRMARFDRGHDFVVYDLHLNKIWFEYTHGHAHKKPRIEYL